MNVSQRLQQRSCNIRDKSRVLVLRLSSSHDARDHALLLVLSVSLRVCCITSQSLLLTTQGYRQYYYYYYERMRFVIAANVRNYYNVPQPDH
jgi:hypothetical protein